MHAARRENVAAREAEGFSSTFEGRSVIKNLIFNPRWFQNNFIPIWFKPWVLQNSFCFSSFFSETSKFNESKNETNSVILTDMITNSLSVYYAQTFVQKGFRALTALVG